MYDVCYKAFTLCLSVLLSCFDSSYECIEISGHEESSDGTVEAQTPTNSEATSEQTSFDSLASSSNSIPVPNLVSSNPIPKVFPIKDLSFGFHAQEVIRTGVLTETGKRQITSELIKAMQKYERYVSA